jgi:hypothetical protein
MKHFRFVFSQAMSVEPLPPQKSMTWFLLKNFQDW